MPILSITGIFNPQILTVDKDFLIIYKPPRMHSAPLASSAGETILDWCAAQFPEIMDLPGRRAGEGGLLHRLDFETQGLMLFARTKSGMEALAAQQQEGKIQKEYSALACEGKMALPGFPGERPELPARFFEAEGRGPLIIQSAFRAYGPGRKAVRPVLNDKQTCERDKLYTTEILKGHYDSVPGILSFRLGIAKGFRHQIRCHLAWLNIPILNDSLYGGRLHGKGLLALRACSLSFTDPSSGKEMNYSIPSLEWDEI